jgi:hypothetical protein
MRHPKVPKWYRIKTCCTPRNLWHAMGNVNVNRGLGWREAVIIGWMVFWILPEDYGVCEGEVAGWEIANA